MLVNEQNDYILVLEKKLKSFCERAPIYLTCTVTTQSVVLENIRTKDIYRFEIDFSVETFDAVWKIRKYLRSYAYPKIIKEYSKNVEPTTDSLNTYMNVHKVSFDKAFTTLSIVKNQEVFVVDKINIKKNQLILLDENGFQHLYELSMPVVIFLNKFSHNEADRIKVYNKLMDNSKFLYTIERSNEKERLDIK